LGVYSIGRIAYISGANRATRSMDKLDKILVVVDPLDATQQVLAKSIVLARHFGARLELFLCDSEHAYALEHAYDSTGVERARQTCLANARRFLEAVRGSVAASDVEIQVDVACESPLYTGVVRKVLRSSPDLVVKCVGREQHGRLTLDANEWQLARACPAPLMFTRGRPWHAQPRFAAAVDVSEEETEGLASTVLSMAEFLARGCQAKLDALYSERPDTDAARHAARMRVLSALAAQHQIAGSRVHVLTGEPETKLPGFLASGAYDVLVIGALTRRPALTSLVGTLTGRLIDELACDFVLVRPESSPRAWAAAHGW
jgi:universal stress protein E